MKSFYREYVLSILRTKQGVVGLILLCFFVFLAIFGTSMVTLDLTVDFVNRYQMPSFNHLLGTDYLGRDILMQLIHGTKDVLLMGSITGVLTILIGFTVGSLAGISNQKVDKVIMFFVDLVLTIPSFPITMLIILSSQNKSPVFVALLMSLFTWGVVAREVRAQILTMRQSEYIVICKVMGLSKLYIMFCEMLPNMVSLIAIKFINAMRDAINTSMGLMLLGAMPYSPTHWGIILNNALTQTGGFFNPRGYIYLLAPIVCLGLFQLSCYLFANGLDEALNPRLRKSS